MVFTSCLFAGCQQHCIFGGKRLGVHICLGNSSQCLIWKRPLLSGPSSSTELQWVLKSMPLLFSWAVWETKCLCWSPGPKPSSVFYEQHPFMSLALVSYFHIQGFNVALPSMLLCNPTYLWVFFSILWQFLFLWCLVSRTLWIFTSLQGVREPSRLYWRF